MNKSNEKLFIDLKYFSSGCHNLALNGEEMADEYRTIFAQLTGRECLRDIQACLRAAKQKAYHMGIRVRFRAIRGPTPTNKLNNLLFNLDYNKFSNRGAVHSGLNGMGLRSHPLNLTRVMPA